MVKKINEKSANPSLRSDRDISAHFNFSSKQILKEIQSLAIPEINPDLKELNHSQIKEFIDWIQFFENYPPNLSEESGLLINLQVDLGLVFLDKIWGTKAFQPPDTLALPIYSFLQKIITQFSIQDIDLQKMESYSNWIQLIYSISKRDLPCCKVEIRHILDKFQLSFFYDLKIKSVNQVLVILEMFLQVNELIEQSTSQDASRERFISSLIQSYFLNKIPPKNQELDKHQRREPSFYTVREMSESIDYFIFENRENKIEWIYNILSLLLGIQYLLIKYYKPNSPPEEFFSQLTVFYERLYREYLRLKGYFQKERVNYFFLQLLWKQFIIDLFWERYTKSRELMSKFEDILNSIQPLMDSLYMAKFFRIKWQGNLFPLRDFFLYSKQQILQGIGGNSEIEIRQYYFNNKLEKNLIDFCFDWTDNNAHGFYLRLQEIFGDRQVTLETVAELEKLLIPSSENQKEDALIKILGEYQNFWEQLAKEYPFNFNLIEKINKQVMQPLKFILARITQLATAKTLQVQRQRPEELLVFISYKHDENGIFHIREIAAKLGTLKGIKKVLYSEKDVTDDFIRYMEKSLSECNVVLLFCSPGASQSRWVTLEWHSALGKQIPIIPVYTSRDDLPNLLISKDSVRFNAKDIPSTIDAIYKIITKECKLNLIPDEIPNTTNAKN